MFYIQVNITYKQYRKDQNQIHQKKHKTDREPFTKSQPQGQDYIDKAKAQVSWGVGRQGFNTCLGSTANQSQCNRQEKVG